MGSRRPPLILHGKGKGGRGGPDMPTEQGEEERGMVVQRVMAKVPGTRQMGGFHKKRSTKREHRGPPEWPEARLWTIGWFHNRTLGHVNVSQWIYHSIFRKYNIGSTSPQSAYSSTTTQGKSLNLNHSRKTTQAQPLKHNHSSTTTQAQPLKHNHSNTVTQTKPMKPQPCSQIFNSCVPVPIQNHPLLLQVP